MQTIQFLFYRLSGRPNSFELPSDFDGVKLNFLEAKPESNVQEVYNASEKLITEAQEALENLKNYKGKHIWSYLPFGFMTIVSEAKDKCSPNNFPILHEWQPSFS